MKRNFEIELGPFPKSYFDCLRTQNSRKQILQLVRKLSTALRQYKESSNLNMLILILEALESKMTIVPPKIGKLFWTEVEIDSVRFRAFLLKKYRLGFMNRVEEYFSILFAAPHSIQLKDYKRHLVWIFLKLGMIHESNDLLECFLDARLAPDARYSYY